LIPSLTTDNSYQVAAKFNQGLVLVGLQLALNAVSGGAIPNAEYLIGIVDAIGGKVIENVLPNQK
jgi:hypothetical protein